jgi:hypothetical protein
MEQALALVSNTESDAALADHLISTMASIRRSGRLVGRHRLRPTPEVEDETDGPQTQICSTSRPDRKLMSRASTPSNLSAASFTT